MIFAKELMVAFKSADSFVYNIQPGQRQIDKEPKQKKNL